MPLVGRDGRRQVQGTRKGFTLTDGKLKFPDEDPPSRPKLLPPIEHKWSKRFNERVIGLLFVFGNTPCLSQKQEGTLVGEPRVGPVEI